MPRRWDGKIDWIIVQGDVMAAILVATFVYIVLGTFGVL